MMKLILINILCYSEFHLVNCAVPSEARSVNGSEGKTKFDPRIVGGTIAHEGDARAIVSAIFKSISFSPHLI